MEELLFGLTPSEWWAWCYLVFLAREQGGTHIILPRPGEDIRAEKVFCRKHFKRILKSLKAKFYLTHLIIPRSKSKRIEVFIPASKIGDLEVLNIKKGYMAMPKKTGLSSGESSINTLGTLQTHINEVIQATLPNYHLPKLKLKEKLESLLKLKQGDLKGGIEKLNKGEIYLLGLMVRQICRFEPRGKKLSEQVRLFAAIRFLQEGDAILRPQAWIDTVARKAAAIWEAKSWRETESGSDGRSRSLPGSEGG